MVLFLNIGLKIVIVLQQVAQCSLKLCFSLYLGNFYSYHLHFSSINSYSVSFIKFYRKQFWIICLLFFALEMKVQPLVCFWERGSFSRRLLCCFLGTPCYVDSEGCVRMLNRGLGDTWTPVCNTREHCKGKSDHYWVVGIHENPQQLRWVVTDW